MKKKFHEHMRAEAARLLDEGRSYRFVAKQFGVSHATVIAHLPTGRRDLSVQAQALRARLLEYISRGPDDDSNSPEAILTSLSARQKDDLDSFCRRAVAWATKHQVNA